MEINKRLDILLKRIKFATDFNLEQIEQRMMLSKGRLSNIKSKGQVTEKFLKSLENEFRREMSAVEGKEEASLFEDSQPTLKKHPTENMDVSAQTLLNLSESNKMLAEANKSLAKSHDDLIEMVKATAGVQPGTSVTSLATNLEVLELLMEIGVKAGKWHSLREARAEINKLAHAAALGK